MLEFLNFNYINIHIEYYFIEDEILAIRFCNWESENFAIPGLEPYVQLASCYYFKQIENSTNVEKEESDNVSNKDADIDSTTERLSGNGQETASTCEPVVNEDTSKRKGKNAQPDQVGVYTIKRAGCLMPLLDYLNLQNKRTMCI